MKKGILTLFVFLFILGMSANAQWAYQGAWPDTNYKGGTHGIVVDPDGKLWQASYYREKWITPNNDTVLTSPIYVFNPDGSLLEKIYTVTTGSVTDTLGKGGSTSGTRGLTKDHQGNILFVSSSPVKMIKINYQTRQGMARRDIGSTEIGSSPTKPAVSNDGTIYVGPVVGGGTTKFIATYDTDLNYLGAAVTGPPAIGRTMEVSGDGLTIYWTPFTAKKMYIYTRPDELSAFALTDSVLEGMSIETATWNPATGNLWVSHDSRGTGYTNLTWYAFDVTTKTLVDSFTLPEPLPGNGDPDKLPRGLAFSSNGNTAYVGLFGTAYDRIYKIDKQTSVDEQGQVVVNGYKLSQNYPNPFNPTTKINFDLKESGFTTLKVYDMLGNEVATLVNKELTNGSHSVNFNAANLASGTYVYQLNVNGNRITNKMVLLK